MASVSENMVREYFECLGYTVMQPCKHGVTGRPRRHDEHIDLVISHPLRMDQHIPEHILWLTDDLKTIARAIVGIYGWHTERFYPVMLEHIPEICHFAGSESRLYAAQKLGIKDPATILCLPQLPVSEKLRRDALELLKQRGVDGVLSFRTILKELTDYVAINKNYEKSDLLQTLRILKNYDLLKTPQLELFVQKKPRPRRQSGQAAENGR